MCSCVEAIQLWVQEFGVWKLHTFSPDHGTLLSSLHLTEFWGTLADWFTYVLFTTFHTLPVCTGFMYLYQLNLLPTDSRITSKEFRVIYWKQGSVFTSYYSIFVLLIITLYKIVAPPCTFLFEAYMLNHQLPRALSSGARNKVYI